ncbi:MAG: MBL fold metallo-hydrolase, partial [Lachnospiraceae bacterium]|nr:MBL fold metallo-hydrolase [Lachnospiraceae bacterium]
ELATIDGISGHADQSGLIRWLEGFRQKPDLVFINHGEDLVCSGFADYLHEGYGYRTAAPYSGAQYDLLSGECLVEAEGVPIEKKTTLSGETAKVYEALKTALAALTRLVTQMKGRTNKEIKKLTGEIEKIVKKHTGEE